MSQVSYDFAPHAELEWCEELSAMKVTWKNLHMSMNRFKNICSKAVEIVLEKECVVWIADMYDSKGVFSPEIQSFIANELVEACKHNTISMVCTILPQNSSLSAMSAKRWNRNVKKTDEFYMCQFQTMEECKYWILQEQLVH